MLSGGGARGAYEVGVLSYLFGDFVRVLGQRPRVDIICGTSVGAINGSFMAAHMGDPVSGVRRLVDLWTSIELQQVLRFTIGHALRLPRVLLGGKQALGIFDVRPMIDLITREVSWRAVARSIRRGLLRAISISATEIATGRTTVFVDAHPDVPVPPSFGARMNTVLGPVGPQHALASAAIPLIFPPVRIGPLLYCDGGLRQNTPMAPAIRMGAESILVVGVSREVRGSVAPEGGLGELTAPGAAFLLGKVLNAFLLDHVMADLDLLGRINEILADGVAAYGPDFVETLSRVATARGAEAYRPVRTMVVRPSQDIGRVAGQHVRTGKVAGPLLTRSLLAALDTSASEEADLASYLLFDGAFARKLIDMGRADAEAQRHQLAEFFAP